MGSSLEAAFRTHLSSATGYYYHLLFRLQQEFGLKLYGILDFNLVPEQKTGKNYNHCGSVTIIIDQSKIFLG
jgi:protein SMG5